MAGEPGGEPPVPNDQVVAPAGVPEGQAIPAPTAAGVGGTGNEEGDLGGVLDLEESKPPKFSEEKPLEVKTNIEKVRAQVARALVAILAVVIFFSFLTLWMVSPPPGLADLEKVLTIIFGPLIALVSGAVGYYFGGKSGGDG